MNFKKASFIVLLILLIDQWSKIYIKTHFQLGESVEVFKWFKIYFIENEGAAWGIKLSDWLPISESIGKLILTVFRLVAIFGIGYILVSTIKKKGTATMIFALSLIFGGALGNLTDSLIYGVLFDHSNHQTATLFTETPYGSVFYGKVVDMLYFPLIDTVLPEWIPFAGGKRFTFFDPVFNLADMAISTGAGIIIFFNKSLFKNTKKKEESKKTDMA